MEMKKLFSNAHYKIMEVTLDTGEEMPLHKATSDAFIIVREGAGTITFTDHKVDLQQGSSQLVPAHKEHTLHINENFKACIIMAPEAEIKFS